MIIFYLTLFLFILGHSFILRDLDYDFFARLIVGKTFFQTGDVMKWDFLSYTPTHEFIDHEWGSSLIFYTLQNNFGDIGLLFFKAIMYFLIFFIITQTIKLRTPKTKLNFLFFLVGINAIPMLLFSNVRCQIFSFFFFVLWLYTLERIRINNETRLFWIFPATMLIWGNLHGGCFAGFGLLVMYIIGEFLNKKPIKNYIITLFASTFVLLINPYGLPYLEFLLSATTMKRELITEWQKTFSFHGIFTCWRYILYSTFFVIVSIFIARKKLKSELGDKKINKENLKELWDKVDKTKIVILIITYLMALKAIRLQVFFIFAICVFLYDDFYYLFSKKLPQKIDKIKEVVLFLAMIVFATNLIYSSKFQCTFGDLPVAEVEFIKLNKLKGNVLCEFHHGSYAAYKLYPHNLIFMDGKYEEVYPNELIYSLKKLNRTKDGWKNDIVKYNTDILIVSNIYPIYKTLQEDKDFHEVMRSGLGGVFVKTKDLKSHYLTPNTTAEHYIKTKYETEINWY